MNILGAWLMKGGVLAWVSSLIKRTAQQGVGLNVVDIRTLMIPRIALPLLALFATGHRRFLPGSFSTSRTIACRRS